MIFNRLEDILNVARILVPPILDMIFERCGGI